MHYWVTYGCNLNGDIRPESTSNGYSYVGMVGSMNYFLLFLFYYHTSIDIRGTMLECDKYRFTGTKYFRINKMNKKKLRTWFGIFVGDICFF